MKVVDLPIGKLVQLKSGGPVMAVASKPKDRRVYCEWSEGGQVRRGAFDRAYLMPSGQLEQVQ